MIKIALISAILLTGCATVQDVQQASSGELCYRVASGHTRGLSLSVFYSELSRRNEDCSRYQAAIANQLRADAAETASGLTLLQMAQPKPAAPIQRGTSCVTKFRNGNAYTDCD